MTTAGVTTAGATSADVTTSDVTTYCVTADVNTTGVTTSGVTTAGVTATGVTTTAAGITATDVTTAGVTTTGVTTTGVSTAGVTTAGVTTSNVTTSGMTSADVTTDSVCPSYGKLAIMLGPLGYEKDICLNTEVEETEDESKVTLIYKEMKHEPIGGLVINNMFMRCLKSPSFTCNCIKFEWARWIVSLYNVYRNICNNRSTKAGN